MRTVNFFLTLLLVSGVCRAADDPKPTISPEAQKEIDRLNEEKAIADAQAAANEAKNKAMFGTPDKPKPLDGSIAIKKGESAISEWATYHALNQALSEATKNVAGTCKKITPVTWTTVSASRARITRISASSDATAENVRMQFDAASRGSAKFVGWPATVMTATQWLAQMASYFRSDLDTVWSSATITPETARSAFVGKLLALPSKPEIAVPYPNDEDLRKAKNDIAPMIAELDRIMEAARAKNDPALIQQSNDLEAKKDELLRKIAEDRAAVRLSDEGYCMLDVKVGSAVSATTTSRNLFRTAKAFDRGSVSITWELVSPGGLIQSAGQVSAICEADTKLTRSTPKINPQCKAF
ncbi:MAG: hypothetical protein J0M19_06175 [Sphingomonadales bacterium]|nr:hypothetical protein [Sphingomonadales bacterium]